MTYRLLCSYAWRAGGLNWTRVAELFVHRVVDIIEGVARVRVLLPEREYI